MTDFEIQRRLRELNAPRLPQTDLWPGIATRIAEAAPAVRRRRPWRPLAAAAALLLAVVTGSIVLGVHQQNAAQDVAAMDTNALPAQKRISPRDAQAFGRAPGGDPRLAGAAVVLDSAHAELQQALEQRPDAVFLVSLLNRTNARRMKLDHYGASAG